MGTETETGQAARSIRHEPETEGGKEGSTPEVNRSQFEWAQSALYEAFRDKARLDWLIYHFNGPVDPYDARDIIDASMRVEREEKGGSASE